MEQVPEPDNRTFKREDFSSKPSMLSQQDLYKTMLQQNVDVSMAASKSDAPAPAPVAPPVNNNTPAASTYTPFHYQMDETITAPELPEDETPPFQFDLVKHFENAMNLEAQEEQKKAPDLSALSEEDRKQALQDRKDAMEGKMLKRQILKENVKKVQGAINAWIPTTLARAKANGDTNINPDALEKFMAYVPMNTDPASRAMTEVLQVCAKEAVTSREKHKADVIQSQKMFKERVELAKQLKESAELIAQLKKENEDLKKSPTQEQLYQQQQLQLQQQQYANQQRAPTNVFRSNEPQQYVQVPQQASKRTFEELTPLGSVLFNASVMTNADSSAEEAYELAKKRSKLFEQYAYPDPNSSNISVRDYYPEHAFSGKVTNPFAR
jgi:hypothetical protein